MGLQSAKNGHQIDQQGYVLTPAFGEKKTSYLAISRWLNQ
jgi:hypothetical protein